VLLHLLLGPGIEANGAALWLAFLLTYSVHAGVWVMVVSLLVRFRSGSPATQHTLWRMALFAPFATSLAAALGASALEPAFGGARQLSASSLVVLRVVAQPLFGAGPSTAEGLASATASPGWSWLARISLLAALSGGTRFALSALLLRSRLHGRRRVTDARWLARLAQLRAQLDLAPVALSQSARISSPLVIGRSEICVPNTALAALDDAEVDGVLAHELAHLERSDGLWFPCAGLLQSVLWMQPFNYVVAARFRHSAELACDDRAVELTANPLSLARALTRLATDASFARPTALPAMASSASTLLQRVRRLASPSHAPQLQAMPRGRHPTFLLLIAVAGATAGLSIEVARAHTRRAWPDSAASARSPSPELAVPTDSASPPDAAALNRELNELLQREHELESQLASELRSTAAEPARTQDSVRVLELRQELSHLRAAQLWTEERYSDAWARWEQARGVSRSAPP
jgi:beta-lactamase regulating signal transducer with metallopeptidase domain